MRGAQKVLLPASFDDAEKNPPSNSEETQRAHHTHKARASARPKDNMYVYRSRISLSRHHHQIYMSLPISIFFFSSRPPVCTAPSSRPLTVKMPPTMAHTLVRKCRNDALRSVILTYSCFCFCFCLSLLLCLFWVSWRLCQGGAKVAGKQKNQQKSRRNPTQNNNNKKNKKP